MSDTNEPGAARERAIGATEIIGAAGVVLLSVGCWMAWQPLGLIAPGVLLTATAYAAARTAAPPAKKGND